MLKKISVADVTVGMYIHKLCGSWMDHPFWTSGFVLQSQADVHSLQSSAVTEVWIDTLQGLDVPTSVLSQTQQQAVEQADNTLQHTVATELQRPESMADEIKRALAIYQRSKRAVIKMFSDARMGKAIEMRGVHKIVNEMTQSILRHPTALLSLVRLKQVDEYTYMHSVAVCALMIALARQLEMDEQQVQQAGISGLLHDIGKMLIDEKILNKPERLTDEEFAQVRLHPVLGAQLLLDSDPNVCSIVYDVCLHHHERYDGSGYPEQLKGQQISLFARMTAICDVYDAITSNRPYKKGWGPADALQRMAHWQGHFDQYIFQSFVRIMGVYPVGSLVRLASGRLAVVIEKNEQALLKPKVKVFFSTKSRLPIEQQVIDLAQVNCQESIACRESVDEWKFRNLDELWFD